MPATPANALDITAAGLVKFDGTATFSAVTTTQHDVLVGGASNGITSVGPGSAGQVLQSGGAAADPAYSTATYPSTTTSQQILYSTANNVVGQLTTANSKLPATNSSGVLAMRAFSVVRQVFAATGTYTPTSGMLYADIEAIGAGGGSGGCTTTSAGTVSGAGGGGGGGYARGVFSAATIGASQAVTIGAGGTAGAAGNNAGGTGGTTSVGALISATGGAGGSGSATAASFVNLGGTGGSGTGGDFQTTGTPGSPGIGMVATSAFLLGGAGGSSFFGGGGVTTTSASTTSPAVAGTSAGGGASGGCNFNNTQITGAAGAIGNVIVTEYVIA